MTHVSSTQFNMNTSTVSSTKSSSSIWGTRTGGNTEIASGEASKLPELNKKGINYRKRLVKSIAKKYSISEEKAEQLLTCMKLREVIKAFNTGDEGYYKKLSTKVELSIDRALAKKGDKTITDANIESVSNTAARYTAGQLRNMSIEDIDDLVSKHKSAASLLDKYIPEELKGKSISEMTPEQRKTIVESYFNEINFKADIEKIKNAKGEEQKELIKALKTKQMEAFTRMAIVADAEDIELLAATVHCVVNEAMPEIIDTVKLVFQKPEHRTRCADAMCSCSMTDTDITGRTMSCEVAQDVTSFITQNADEDHAKIFSDNLNSDIKYARGVEKKVLEIVGKEKLSDLSQEDIDALLKNPDISKEEKDFLVNVILSGTLKGFTSGSIAGFADNQVISDDFRQQILQEINANASELTNYDEILEAVKTYIDEHSEQFSPESKERIENALNQATGGKYGEVAQRVEAGRSEGSSNGGSAQSDSGVGFNNPSQKPVTPPDNKTFVDDTEKEPEFTIEKTSSVKPQASSVKLSKANLFTSALTGGYEDMATLFRTGYSRAKYVGESLKNLRDASAQTKDFITRCLSTRSFAEMFAGFGANDSRVARMYIEAGNEDLIGKNGNNVNSFVDHVLESAEENKPNKLPS